MHALFNALMIQEIVSKGSTFIFPILVISNISQGAACFSYSWLQRKKDRKIKDLGYPSGINCLLGITEPAMYGVNLKFFFPFLSAIISSACGALLLMIFNVKGSGIGSGGVLGFLSVKMEANFFNIG